MKTKAAGVLIPIAIMVVGVWGLSYLGQPLRSYIDIALIILSVGSCLYLYFKWRLEYYPWARQMLLLGFFIAVFYLWTDLFHYIPLHGIYSQIVHITSIVFGITLLACLFAFDFWKPRHKRAWAEFSIGELIWWYISAGKDMESGYLSDEDETKKIEQASGAGWGVYLELKRRGQDRRLIDLLRYKNNGVKFLAARHLLWTAEQDSLNVLDELGKLQNDLGRDARGCAKAWRAKEILPDQDIPNQSTERSLWKKLLDTGAIMGVCITICLAILSVYLGLNYKPPAYSNQVADPVELSNLVMSKIQQHGPNALGLFYASSTTTYWGTQNGYLVPLGGWYQVYSPYFHTLTDATTSKAVANLEQYTEKLLANYGFNPDPYNTSTSTDNGPFYRLRTGYVSSDGALHCVMQLPQRWRGLSQWYFQCALTTDIEAMLQKDMPYFNALGNPRGTAVFPVPLGNFAKVDVGNESELFYSAILVKTGDEWNAIYTVSGSPPCALMEAYAVPQAVYGSCLGGNTI